MIVDTSILLAIHFGESHGSWAVQRLQENSELLMMSTVNLTETLIRLRDRQPDRFTQLENRLLTSGIRFVPPDLEQARIAAQARLRYPLNLGDCFAYALAKVERLAILTLDGDFRHLDVPVVMP